jgi:hypothetical protein
LIKFDEFLYLLESELKKNKGSFQTNGSVIKQVREYLIEGDLIQKEFSNYLLTINGFKQLIIHKKGRKTTF